MSRCAGWPALTRDVFDHVSQQFPVTVPEEGDPDFGLLPFKSDLEYEPDSLPDAILAALIDPPDGKGLRWTQVQLPAPKVLLETGSRLSTAPPQG